MLSRLKNMFRVADLRNKIIFTILMVGVYRVGTHIPVPYVDFAQIQKLQDSSTNAGVVGFLDLFSGGAITSVSIKNAMLHPSPNHGHLLDPVGPSSLEGTIAAKSDDSAVRQVLDDLHSTTAAASDTPATPY